MQCSWAGQTVLPSHSSMHSHLDRMAENRPFAFHLTSPDGSDARHQSCAGG